MFLFNRNTQFFTEVNSLPVINAVQILERDRDKVFKETEKSARNIYLVQAKEQMEEEQYQLEVKEEQITITAADDLGFVYGLLYISENYLGITPFWFWMDQKIMQRDKLEIPAAKYISKKPVVRFRGWFFNDEVLMMKWKYNRDSKEGWKMAFEALLRCGGNMAIPGTDKMASENRKMASEMGLWITHHHAEPLGAEMFAREYPDLEPNYLEYTDLFYKLWEDAVVGQKDCKVVWNLCFRGQGDAPFWSYDTTGQFNTPQKRGKMISDVIRKQSDIVRKYIKNPIFCTNLYGEIMELYQQGCIELDPDVIKVYADNGYGKMVTRRRDNHDVRVPSMPDRDDKGAQGIYYHVSFYDLQAASHITMLPNSVDFVNRELNQVLENGGNDFWIINCSNVRPHVYYLDVVRKKWFGRDIDDKIQSEEFAADYFQGNKQIAECYCSYPKAMISYGSDEDEHMGEQFYTENTRIIAHQFLTDREHGAKALRWIAGDISLPEQAKKICALCRDGLQGLEELYQQCKKIKDSVLFDSTLKLQAAIHYFCAKGLVTFGEALCAYQKEDYVQAFLLSGQSAEYFDEAQHQMSDAEYGVWQDFYFNDCFADIKHTAYMVRKVMGYIREMGDNVRHDKWYREYCYSEKDRNVFLLLVTDNHMTDQEIYQVMKNSKDISLETII